MLLFSFPTRLIQRHGQYGATAQAGIPISAQSIIPSSYVWRKRTTGVTASFMVAFVLHPLVSAIIDAAEGDHSSPVRFLITLGVFGLTYALVQRAPTSRSAFGRGLLLLGISLILTPTSLSIMLALQLQDWATISTEAVVLQTGSVAAFLFGGVFIANALLFGLMSGTVLLLIGRVLARRKPSAC